MPSLFIMMHVDVNKWVFFSFKKHLLNTCHLLCTVWVPGIRHSREWQGFPGDPALHLLSLIPESPFSQTLVWLPLWPPLDHHPRPQRQRDSPH